MIGDTTLTDTIVAGQTGGADIRVGSGSVSGNDNLIGDGSGISGGTGNLLGTTSAPINPLLAPLGDYGGPTPTIALLPGSPAIGAGTGGNGIPTTDQRGYARGSSVDIGAFQDQGFTLTPVAGSTPQSAFAGTTFAEPAGRDRHRQQHQPVHQPGQRRRHYLHRQCRQRRRRHPLGPQGGDPGRHGQRPDLRAGGPSVTATANTVVGSYTVTALASGVGRRSTWF